MPAISVIIPTYNHEEFIEQAVDSVLAQTYTDFEIIIINDGSPDHTARRVEPYLHNEFIHYYEKKNEGQATARNMGLNKASGDFIAFLDDDDIWPADKLEWQYQYLSDSDNVAVAGTYGVFSDGTKQTPKEIKNERLLRFEDFFHGNPFVSPGQVLIRTDTLRSIGGFDTRIWGADDLDMWMRLARKGSILHINRIALWYRKHRENASKNRIKMLINSNRVLQKNLNISDQENRKQLRCIGYRWLYDYAGREIFVESKQSLKRLQIKHFIRLMSQFTKAFFPQIFWDSVLARSVGMDCIPNRIRDRFGWWEE